MVMSMDMSSKLSNVQASAKSCPGGGGNTGYFQRGRDDEEKSQLGFKKDIPLDSFENSLEKGAIEGEIQNQSFLTIFKNLFFDFIEMIMGLFIKDPDKYE